MLCKNVLPPDDMAESNRTVWNIHAQYENQIW